MCLTFKTSGDRQQRCALVEPKSRDYLECFAAPSDYSHFQQKEYSGNPRQPKKRVIIRSREQTVLTQSLHEDATFQRDCGRCAPGSDGVGPGSPAAPPVQFPAPKTRLYRRW